MFAFFADPRALPLWDPGVRAVQALDGDPRVGARFAVDAALGDPLIYEIIEWTSPCAMEWTSSAGSTQATDRFEFAESEGGGTVLRISSKFEVADESPRVNGLRQRMFRAAAAAAVAGARTAELTSRAPRAASVAPRED